MIIPLPYVGDHLVAGGVVSVQVVPDIIRRALTVDAFKVGAYPPHVKDVNEAVSGAHNQNGRGAHSARSHSLRLRTLHVKMMSETYARF